MNQLYPAIEPYEEFFLSVSDLHTIRIEQAGNPRGQPVVFIHGGPGGGIEPVYRQFFNPEKWRIILFDQRGCGKSTPFAELRENTTWDLVADMEKIREKLGIAKWAVFGGSWGSTLALAYSETHPERCSALFLRGIFLLRQSELEWFYQDGASHIFPDAWEKYLAPIPEAERDNLLAAYHRRLTSDDADTRLDAAKAWSIWEGSTSKLYQSPEALERFGASQFAEAFARIECHYFINKGFMDSETQLIDNIDRIRHIQAVIVQGRYDVVCPMNTAWELHRAWPEADFHVIPDAGHSMTEPGIRSKLIDYTDQFSG